ncbi:RNA polymerase sigma factor [Natronogracilivirga saccharolytica]|uniref:RNA polymerase sigma factor n=1 Tax=Natronogracilivirga saccharolytica TaxID=2812953 RepID=A0A8J7S6L8_9BACT|nr:RNA polymerase sigma factor [Natronogracilivirga saccharolytica]MBP3191228.1 RNA polymerase sigma factor [Natronogracilivirga saccharolytica]
MSSYTLTEHELNQRLPEFYPRIYRMVRAMVHGSGIDPEDLTQDIFLKVYNKRHLYNASSGLYTWTYQIARNTVLDALRRNKIQRRIFWWSDAEEEPVEFDSGEAGDETLDRRERQKMLHEALAALSEKDRLIITMRDLEGMAYDEIAEIENISVGTVKSRLFTARQRLKKELMRLGVHHQFETDA